MNYEPIKLTDQAASKIKQLMADDTEAEVLRVAVSGGGCSGFQYALGFDSRDNIADDMTVESHGVEIVVDEMSLEYLEGSEIDYSDGLHGKGFAFNNPNATGCCGCGQSFSC